MNQLDDRDDLEVDFFPFSLAWRWLINCLNLIPFYDWVRLNVHTWFLLHKISFMLSLQGARTNKTKQNKTNQFQCEIPCIGSRNYFANHLLNRNVQHKFAWTLCTLSLTKRRKLIDWKLHRRELFMKNYRLPYI